MKFRYFDGSRSGPKSFTHDGVDWPKSILVKRSVENDAQYASRLSEFDVTPIREIPCMYDPNTQSKGDSVESTNSDGWIEISWPTPVDNIQAWDKSTRKSAYFIPGQVPSTHTTVECPGDCYDWDEENEEWDCQMDELREMRCDEVDELYLSKQAIPLSYNSMNWDVDGEAQNAVKSRTLYAMMHKQDGATFPWSGTVTEWVDADNEDRAFATADDFLAFAKAVNDHVDGVLFQQRKTHKAALRDDTTLTTPELVEGYDIAAGW